MSDVADFDSPSMHFLHLLHKAVFAFDRHADRVLHEQHQCSFSQFLVLLAVGHCPAASQRDIAAFLNLTPAAVSRMLDTLVQSGMLSREQSPASRRTNVVTLTPAGATHLRDMQSALAATFTELTESISEKHLRNASGTMEMLLGSLGIDYTDCPQLKVKVSKKN